MNMHWVPKRSIFWELSRIIIIRKTHSDITGYSCQLGEVVAVTVTRVGEPTYCVRFDILDTVLTRDTGKPVEQIQTVGLN